MHTYRFKDVPMGVNRWARDHGVVKVTYHVFGNKTATVLHNRSLLIMYEISNEYCAKRLLGRLHYFS